MNKSFYKEALLDIVTEALEQPDKSVIIEHTGLNELKKALEQAHKQEKLLELYKEINNKRKELITLSRHNTWSWKLDVEIRQIEKQIKELENDK